MRFFCTAIVCVFLNFATPLVAAETDQPLAPTDAAATAVVPEGFRVTMFAAEPDVRQPIGFCIDDRGRLWVAEAYNYPHHGTRPGDRILIFEDTDGDGRHDKRTVFYDKLNYVSGIEVGFGGVWVMSPPTMYFIPDSNGDDVPDSEPTILLDGFGNHANAHNMANAFAWGPDGWLYATHGRTNWSMIGKPGTPEDQRVRFDGGVWRYHPVRHEWEPYADGTTNPWGIDWNDFGHAFVCNCVNPHLFQVIQGAHYEPWRGRKSSQYAYQRIDTIADHLHFVGLGNVRNGLGSDAEDNAGGGHAHCGTMIYLGDQFPKEYRNQLFTNNIHGRRINNDFLKRSGSGYIASHGPDLMKSRDPWFMGVLLTYGPNGEVYVIDWSDTGECHSTRNTRKETGRIYRITFGETKLPPVDMSKKSNTELVELQRHENDWRVRHARRILQERAVKGNVDEKIADQLRQMLDTERSIPKKLRALWAIHSIGRADIDLLRPLLNHEDENIRSWAITLIGQLDDVSRPTQDTLVDMASNDHAPLVRLSLASFLQGQPFENRWAIAEQLAKHSEDADDQNLPLMNWYAIEPLIDDDLDKFTRFAFSARLPRVRMNVARRCAEHSTEAVELLCKGLAEAEDDHENTAMKLDVVSGMLQGLEGRQRHAMPLSWPNAYRMLVSSENRVLRQKAIELAAKFNDAKAILSLKQLIGSHEADPQTRQDAIRILSSKQIPGLSKLMLGQLSDPSVRMQVLSSLASYRDAEIAPAILDVYPELGAAEKTIALATLASRLNWATQLVKALEANRISKDEMTAFVARQILSLGDKELSSRVNSIWGTVRTTPRDRAKKISNLKKWLTPDLIASADVKNGKALFSKHCATCHQFFGEGGKVGPDITGAQRTNIDYMLENIVDPSASVAADYQMHIIQMDDGRVVTGLIESETADVVTIRTATEQVKLAADEVEQRKRSRESVMPSGILDALSDQEIRDLFGYLQR